MNTIIGYINVNKGVFCLIISYLRIKIYNVLNYNNCSTDWSFPLIYFVKILNWEFCFLNEFNKHYVRFMSICEHDNETLNESSLKLKS